MTPLSDRNLRRVLFVSSSARLGGGNRFLMATGTELQRRGIAVGIAFLGEGPAIEMTRAAGLETHVWSLIQPERSQPWTSLLSLARSTRQLRRWTPDVVHANDIGAARAVAMASRIAGASTLCHFHRIDPLIREELTWAFRGLPAPLAMIDVCRRGYDLNRDAIEHAQPDMRHRLLYNGIEIGEAPVTRSRPDRRKRIGSVANLIPVKRCEDLLEMAAGLIGKHPEIELWLIGDDSVDPAYTATLHSRRDDLGLGERVRFVGRSDDVPSLLPQLDVFVHAAEKEACPLSVLEALAAGLPIVATAVGAVAEKVEDGIHGLLVPPRRPDLLIDKVDRLLCDSVLAEEMGKRGRLLAEETFDIRRVVDRLLQLYRELHAPGERDRP